ncbi:MAG: hypothetical protein RAO94_07395 [Candidatus Stygibacter australis]|nr:hypothetical protein [Candidatus Stygibacter australis]MDP8322157.1 hypothetical protein [Candidatus Stygibacter australis]
MKKKFKQFPLGVWISLIALLLIFFAWLMQAYSLINWEGAVKLGVQNESFSGTEVEQTLADVEKGIALADIIWVLPLTILAFGGILKKNLLGFVSGMMVFAICVYFPIFYFFRDSMNYEIKLAALVLWAIPSLFGIAGLWVNRALFIRRD